MNITTKKTVTVSIELKDLEELVALQNICDFFVNRCTVASDTEKKVARYIIPAIQDALQ